MYCPPKFTDAEDGTGNVVEGTWRTEVGREGLERIGSVGSNRFGQSASEVRECFYRERFYRYFMSPQGELQCNTTIFIGQDTNFSVSPIKPVFLKTTMQSKRAELTEILQHDHY